MEKLFGLSMNSIAACLGSVLIIVLFALALVAWRSRVMFKLGLRPIPRRRAQSTLIVLGLMLATLIITAAFVTGDTLSHTIRSLVIDELGEIDETIRLGSGGRSYASRSAVETFFKFSRYEELAAELSGYEPIDAIVPAIQESIPAVNTTRRRSERSLQIVAVRPEDAAFVGAGDLADSTSNALRLDDLGPHEVYLNAPAAESLDAAPGDELKLYTGPKPTTVYIRAIATTGENPQLFISLKRAQALFDQLGRINIILISNVGDALKGAELTHEVTAHLRGLLTDKVVAAQIFEMLNQDSVAIDALREAAADQRGNTQQDLLKLADGLASPKLTDETRNLLADEGLTAQVQSILADADWRSQAARDRLEDLFADLSELGVYDIKRDNLDQGELAASAFTTIFVVTGLFGIAAGLLLIFLIFVMLAAERKSEMGMTRAIGGQRGHLVQMFVFEGTAYDLAAAAVGVALGVGTGFLVALTLGSAFAESGLTIRPYMTGRSLVVSYSLGMLVTFTTVLFSAYRVSRLNIVAAIRDLPEPPHPPSHLRDRLLAPFHRLIDGFRHLRRGRIIRALWTWFVGIPLSLLGVVWLGFTTGPLTLLLGLLMTLAGLQSSTGATYSLGVSFAIIGAGLTLRGLLSLVLKKRPGLTDRIAFTLIGLGLTIFWSLPEDAFGVTQEFSYGAEMFFISGILLVAGAVMVVMYNADLLLRAILSLLGGARHLAPVLRMAIAFPLANRFRTGLTVGMFAIVVFSVIFMATMFKVNEAYFENIDALTGGFDLRANTNDTNPVPDLESAIASSPYVRPSDYEVVAAESTLAVEMRQGNDRWKTYLVRGVDGAYLNNIGYDMAVMAEGYHSAAEVWQAVRDRPGYAVIDRYGVPSRQSTSIIIGGPEFRLEGIYFEDETMPPMVVEVREPRTGATFKVTIIGVLATEAYAAFNVYTSQATLDHALPFALSPTTHYLRLANSANPKLASLALENAFLKHGLQSTVLAQEIKDGQKSQRAIEYLLQGFLTLGLVVGVAALGVISTRAVVERRQQIGMLRALGFQREMVAWSFMIESSFVALLGIGLGAALALIPAYHMINSMTSDLPGLRFQVPWGVMSIVIGLAYGMALLTTWLPAVQASRVSPAEALRYE
ncbi:MAG: FtsX-like permease family protein [Chloroflexota bacterium]